MTVTGITKTVGIAVICKTPEAGKSKTRLSPPLKPEQCAEISACFISDLAANMQTLCGAAEVSGYACYTPLGSEDRLKRLLPDGFDLVLQVDGDFGERLRCGLRDILSLGHHGALMINADSPTLPPEILQEAIQALLREDCVVLSPAIDGGYTLIGISHPHARLFEDIPWSTQDVYRLTLERAAEIGLKVCQLDTWYDVDDAATLDLLHDELSGRYPEFACKRHPFAQAPATRRYLETALITTRPQAKTT